MSDRDGRRGAGGAKPAIVGAGKDDGNVAGDAAGGGKAAAGVGPAGGGAATLGTVDHVGVAGPASGTGSPGVVGTSLLIVESVSGLC